MNKRKLNELYEEFNADYYFKNPDKSWSESEEEELTREQRIHEFKRDTKILRYSKAQLQELS